jgi:hypothetical protein
MMQKSTIFRLKKCYVLSLRYAKMFFERSLSDYNFNFNLIKI